MRLAVFLLVHGLAALVPFATWQNNDPIASASFAGWPQHFEGRALQRLALSDRERGFVQGFPGQIARFSDGSREIVMRWIERPSRKLHPAADCFKGAGYTTGPQPIRLDAAGQHWGCFTASQNGRQLHVCERVYDAAGKSWSDVSSWYWAAMLGKTSGPWWAVTIAEEGRAGW